MKFWWIKTLFILVWRNFSPLCSQLWLFLFLSNLMFCLFHLFCFHRNSFRWLFIWLALFLYHSLFSSLKPRKICFFIIWFSSRTFSLSIQYQFSSCSSSFGIDLSERSGSNMTFGDADCLSLVMEKEHLKRNWFPAHQRLALSF